MDRLVERCAGLDVHKDSVAATVRVPGGGRERLQETRTFSATTRGLLTLADWLASYGVTLVGMESTGVYWKPVAPAGGALRVLALERAAPAQRAGAQDRRARLGLDLSAARARAGAGELRAAETDPGAARSDPLPQDADRGAK